MSIDGTDGSGKTTLGRFLAWFFNVTLVESDNFILEDRSLSYDVDAVRAVIRRRLERPRPVLIEGVVVLRLLAQIGYQSNFHIHLMSGRQSSSKYLANELKRYELEFEPRRRANLILTAEHE